MPLRDVLAALSLEQKVRLLGGADFWSLYPEPAAGLRRLVVSDGTAGVRGERWDERDTSANVPSPPAWAAGGTAPPPPPRCPPPPPGGGGGGGAWGGGWGGLWVSGGGRRGSAVF